MGLPVRPPSVSDVASDDEEGMEGEEVEIDETWVDPSPNGELGRLFAACEVGDVAAVAALAPACSEFIVSGRLGPEGDTPLHLAALYGHFDVVRVLLAAGASAGALDDNHGTALHDSAAGGYLDIVRVLLPLSAPDAADGDAETALHTAARGGHREVVALLLRSGFSPLLENAYGQKPLDVVDPADAATARLLAEAQLP